MENLGYLNLHWYRSSEIHLTLSKLTFLRNQSLKAVINVFFFRKHVMFRYIPETPTQWKSERFSNQPTDGSKTVLNGNGDFPDNFLETWVRSVIGTYFYCNCIAPHPSHNFLIFFSCLIFSQILPRMTERDSKSNKLYVKHVLATHFFC